MPKLKWDQVGERFYETGVDHGVLYLNRENAYTNGVVWNGLVSITESPGGAEANDQYADNIKYLSLRSAETFGATLECFTYPEEWGECNGAVNLVEGVTIYQQSRKMFGLSYRTIVGNDTEGNEYGYKLHLVYGCTAAPSEQGYSTVNDSPDPITFSYEITTTPVPVEGHQPTALLTIDSRKAGEEKMKKIEDILYGTDEGTDAPRLPFPEEVLTILAAG